MLTFRALLFYLGYSISLVLHACLSLIFGIFMPIKLRYRFLLLWNRFAIWWLSICCGVKHEIIGADNIPNHSMVVLSNHQSPWETIYLYVLFLPICATLKQELLSIPFFGWALKLLNPIAIDRSKARSARDTLLSQGKKRLSHGISVLVFPEGTRVDINSEKKYSTGGASLAIDAGVPILPVAHNAGYFWPAHQLKKTPGTIKVVIGEPIYPTAESNARELTNQIENWIRNNIQRP